MKYGNITLGQVEAIINKLGGEEEALRFLRGELKLEISKFPVWETVKIGVHKNLGAVTTMLTNFKVSDLAKNILSKPAFKLAEVEEDILLCIATVKELTGKNQATTTEIFNAIKLFGDLCPAEVGPTLREQYLDQSNNEWLRVAMEPIKDSDGNLFVFDVGRDDDELWLGTSCADPTDVWDGGDRFVFRSRK